MFWDLPSILVVGGLVAGGIVWIVLAVRAEGRRDARTRATAASLLCPHCGSQTLEWPGTWWEIDTLHDDWTKDYETGPLFQCAACGRKSRYTERGDFHSEYDLGPAPRTH